MEKKRKFNGFKKNIIAIAALLSVSAVSYAGYTAITGNTTLKKSNIQLEGMDMEVDTIQYDGVENNGVLYKVEIPDGWVMENEGVADIYKYAGEKGNEEQPNCYMKVMVIDANQIESETDKIKKEMKKYFKYDYETVEYYTQDKKVGINGYDAKLYHISKGVSWNSEQIDVYIIKINDKRAMVIENAYFMEATEGWGDIVNQLITNTLEIFDYDVSDSSSENENNNDLNQPDNNASTGNEGMIN